jgi:xanthine dehydrogenase YagS FAD-binding subunit
MPLEDFFVLPDVNPQRENVLEPNEVVTEVHVPQPKARTKSTYVKVRERGSFDFALVSVAANFEMNGGTCSKANVVLGGVAPIPWRSKEAEAALNGKRITDTVAKQAGEAAVANAEPMTDNGYKVPLTRNIISRAAMTLA